MELQEHLPAFSASSFIRSALKVFSRSQIEGGLVRHFLQCNSLDAQNPMLESIISSRGSERFQEMSRNVGVPSDLDSLLEMLEFLVEAPKKKSEGVFYTPRTIVDYIVGSTIHKDGRVVDPSCGAGAFLIGSLRRLGEISRRPLKEIAEDSIFGFDISPRSVRHSTTVVLLYLLQNGEDVREVTLNIHAADALNLFSDSPAGKEWENRFDFVVGNPPYVRFQDLSHERRHSIKQFPATFRGYSCNLYFAFFEIGDRLLNGEGRLGYIVPNSFFTTFAARGLRNFLRHDAGLRRMVNFRDCRMFQASSYTCMVFTDRAWKEGYAEYAEIASGESDRLDGLEFGHINLESLEDRKWRLMRPDDLENVRKIENAGIPLGRRFDISVGIATLKDSVFIVSEDGPQYCVKEHLGNLNRIERGITRRIVRVPSFGKGKQRKRGETRIIFPYRLNKAGKFALMPEKEMKESYPLCYSYLASRREELEAREKGSGRYKAWYAYGRTQGLESHGPRLYTRTFSKGPDFMPDEGDALFCNGYAVFIDRDIELYRRILNSSVMDYYMRKTSTEISGGYQCYQKNYIERFSVPDLSRSEKEFILNSTDKKEIDSFLVNAYGLDLH